MSCNPEVLKQVPLFALLDDDEIAHFYASLAERGVCRRLFRVRFHAPANTA